VLDSFPVALLALAGRAWRAAAGALALEPAPRHRCEREFSVSFSLSLVVLRVHFIEF